MSGMTNDVRRVLREAGYIEARGANKWGYDVAPESTPGVVRIHYVPPSSGSSRQIGNGRVSEYVRTLQSNGFDVRRIPGVTEVDRLLVMRKVKS